MTFNFPTIYLITKNDQVEYSLLATTELDNEMEVGSSDVDDDPEEE